MRCAAARCSHLCACSQGYAARLQNPHGLRRYKMAHGLGLWGIPVAILSGAIRASTPFLFVSLGEVITERSGRVNLGLEGTLVMGAMSGYGVSYLTGSPWLGVLGGGGG